MIEPWFSPSFAYVPGVVLGCSFGLFGSLAGFFAARGKGAALWRSLLALLGMTSGALFLAGTYALLVGQPYGVWYALGFPGLLGLVLAGGLRVALSRTLRASEERRIAAQDL